MDRSTKPRNARSPERDAGLALSGPSPAARFRAWAARPGLAAAAAMALLFSAARLGADPQDELRARINGAIERGREYLVRALAPRARGGDYEMGRLALGLTALLKAGQPSASETVQATLRALERLAKSETYSVSCYLLALDAYWQAQVREAAWSDDLNVELTPPQAEGKVRAAMQDCLGWLLDAMVPVKGIWHYGPSEEGYDHSNTQFAVLGLGVALEHGLEVRREALVAIAEHFLKAQARQGGAFDLRLTPEAPADEFYRPPTVVRLRRLRVQPGGWEYQGASGAVSSMTAAGVANLVVVRDGLKRQGALGRDLERAIERGVGDGLGWIARHLDEFIRGGGRPYFYTLYSLEKACDLAEVQGLELRDWYAEGAEALLGRQQGDGGWGGLEDSALALLFLTRATRPSLRALPPPVVFTAGANAKPERLAAGDQVYIETLQGFVSARDFFVFLMRLRTAKLLPLAEQVVRNFPLHRREELIPALVKLWTPAADGVSAFARKALAEITGAAGRKREFYFDYALLAREVTVFCERGGEPERLGELLRRASGMALKSRLLDFVERRWLAEALPWLIDELGVADVAYRSRVDALLRRFGGPVAPPPGAPRLASADGAESALAAWKSWWSEHGAELLARARGRRLVAALHEHHADDEARQSALRGLIDCGQPAAPALIEALRQPRCRLEVVLALEAISGARLGFDAASWQSWWQERR